jgi:hypothetical protein
VAMSPDPVPAAASALLGDLLDRSVPTTLVEVARSRSAVHYETGRDDVPVLSVCTSDAVRLPASMLTTALPSGRCEIRAGALRSRTVRWRVVRWWSPPRPRGLTPPALVSFPPEVEPLESLTPQDLVGLGPGLTPSGDDVVAGALVAAPATSDPRFEVWRAQTRAALRVRRTTAVSRALLQSALEGYATPELAAFVVASCRGDAGPAARSLLAVGYTSGASLAAGALHVLSTRTRADAA